MEYILTIKPREKKGKEYAKKVRREGFVPAVIYGKGEENTNIIVNALEFETFYRKSHGENVIITLKMENKGDKKAIIKDIQRDPIYGKLQHIDFQIIHAGEKIVVNVPIVLIGVPKGVREGGVLEHIIKDIQLRALPTELPPHIELNIEHLDIGERIKVGDIKLAGIDILEDPEETICIVLHPRKEEAKHVEIEETAGEKEEEKPKEEGEKTE